MSTENKAQKILANVGTNIAKFRNRSKLSEVELASKVGVTGNVIKDYESGKVVKMDFELLSNIADSLGICVGDIISNTNIANIPSDIELEKVELNYKYMFRSPNKEYTVLSTRNAKPGADDHFVTKCLNSKGNEIPDGALKNLLMNKMYEVVREYKNHKKRTMKNGTHLNT